MDGLHLRLVLEKANVAFVAYLEDMGVHVRCPSGIRVGLYDFGSGKTEACRHPVGDEELRGIDAASLACADDDLTVFLRTD